MPTESAATSNASSMARAGDRPDIQARLPGLPLLFSECPRPANVPAGPSTRGTTASRRTFPSSLCRSLPAPGHRPGPCHCDRAGRSRNCPSKTLASPVTRPGVEQGGAPRWPIDEDQRQVVVAVSRPRDGLVQGDPLGRTVVRVGHPEQRLERLTVDLEADPIDGRELRQGVRDLGQTSAELDIPESQGVGRGSSRRTRRRGRPSRGRPRS